MKYIKLFDNYKSGDTLIIVDVQRSFFKFINNKYLKELNIYCKEFESVIQIFDNHFEEQKPDKDFLYHDEPDVENTSDLYKFNNQTEIIEKRYTHNVNIAYFKNILTKEQLVEIKKREQTNSIKIGELFVTTEDTALVYIGNAHKWFHLGKKLYDLFKKLKNKSVVIVGGASDECLEDVLISAKSVGVDVKTNKKFVYSATHCPIK